MRLFKEEKHQPIKFRNYKFIGYHKDYGNACYYFKPLDRDNFELMECMLEGAKRPEIGAGSNVKIIDAFMSNYLYLLNAENRPTNRSDFVKYVVENTYNDFTKEQKELMLTRFNSKVPDEIKELDSYKKYIKDGYNVLYCSNDENEERVFGVVNLVLVKEDNVKINKFNIDRNYTLFKPFKFRVSPAFLKGKSKVKYIEEDNTLIAINHDLLI